MSQTEASTNKTGAVRQKKGDIRCETVLVREHM